MTALSRLSDHPPCQMRSGGRLFRSRLAGLIRRWLRREDGTATMEFVLVLPVIMMIFMASFESGLLMTRSIMLEQSVDMTIRELRLGHYPVITNRVLKKEICARTIIFPDCTTNIKIQMVRVSTASWNVPKEPDRCINRRSPAEAVVDYGSMLDNDLMIMRVCVTLQAMFPSTGIALKLPLDNDGGYALVARTAFSIEPT